MKNIGYLLISIGAYVLILNTPGINIIAKPIEILCTFLHEFGHAFFSMLSGGTVHSLCVNMDGSGVTTTSGGSQGLCTMGGYVGSALFGNIMIYLAIKGHAGSVLKLLAFSMFISAFFWFDNITTTIALFIFAIGLLVMSFFPLKSFMLAFIGVASIIYIIQDFNVGPTSDLQAYESEVGIFPAGVWMYIWLGIVICMTGFNFINLLKNKNK